MALSVADLRNRLQQLNRRADRPKDIWKAKDEHVVRVLPYPYDESPFIELYFHYDLGDAPAVLCPKMNRNDECVVCDFADKLKAWKDPETGEDKPESLRKADFELFKKIQAKARVFVPVVERLTKDGKDAGVAGPFFWSITPKQADKILEECLDTDNLAECGYPPGQELRVITDPDKAYDFSVSAAKPGEKGNTTSFFQVTIKPKKRPSPLMASKKDSKELVAKVKKIDEVYPPVSSDEVERILKKFMGQLDSEAKPEGGTEKYNGGAHDGRKEEVPEGLREPAADKGSTSLEDAVAALALGDN
jgi:hypothetical protein